MNGHSAAPGPEIGSDLPDVPRPGPAEEGVALALMPHIDRMAQQTAGLARIQDLETDLKQRDRRLQQLMGERDELRSLLARRDLEVSRLNREIGAIAARAEPGAGHSPAWFVAARRVFDKLHRARPGSRGAKPAGRPPPQPVARTEQSPLVAWIKDRPPKDVLAVVALGLREAEIERVLQAVERSCAERQIAPLLLTDNDSFGLFRNRRVLFEFLPPPSDQQRLAVDLDWRLYTLRRLALIRRKWQPSRVVAFGRTATEVMQLWLDSPFERTPIAAATRCDPAVDSTAPEVARVSA